MSSKVKQANFRLPLEYMSLIDEISQRESITKAAVIMKALDSLKASYEGGGAAAAASAQAEKEIEELKTRLSKAESRADEASRRASSAESARDAAEDRARKADDRVREAEDRAREAERLMQSASSSAATVASSEAELRRLQDFISTQERQIKEKEKALEAELAERDAKINELTDQLGAATAKAELALKNINVEAVPIGAPSAAGDDEPTRALAMLNMIGGVMNAFQQQVDDARAIGEQEGRMAVHKELQDTIEKARNDGYRDAMSYLDDRVTTARDSGAREERARIANMAFFERRRYLRMHIA